MLELDSAIQHLKESLADPTHKWACEECKQEHEQLLVWLEDYKQLKDDYADLDNRLRTANTEIDRLQSVSSWIPCSERMPETTEKGLGVLYSDCLLVVSSETGWTAMAYCLTDGKKSWWEFADAQNKIKIDWDEVTHWMPLPNPPDPAEKPCGGDDNAENFDSQN